MGNRNLQTGSCASYDRVAERRRRIVSAARRLFVEHGFHATGVAWIAAASGVAVGQLYRDFAAKEDIVAVLVAEECTARLAADGLGKAVATRDPEALWRWLRGMIESGEARSEGTLVAEMLAESARNERIAGIVAGSHARTLQLVSTALASLVPGEAAGSGRDTLAEIILGHSLGLAHLACLQRTGPSAGVVDAVVLSIQREVERLKAL